MTTFQNAPKKVLLTAGLFSLFLVTTATHKAMAATTDFQQPLTTVATLPISNQIQAMNANIESDYECDESKKDAQIQSEGQKVSWGYFLRRRRFSIWRRIFG